VVVVFYVVFVVACILGGCSIICGGCSGCAIW